jgi:hypothetical protein
MELVRLVDHEPFLLKTTLDVISLIAEMMRSTMRMKQTAILVMITLIQMKMVLCASQMSATTQLSISTLTDPAKNVSHTSIPILIALLVHIKAALKRLVMMVQISLISLVKSKLVEHTSSLMKMNASGLDNVYMMYATGTIKSC